MSRPASTGSSWRRDSLHEEVWKTSSVLQALQCIWTFHTKQKKKPSRTMGKASFCSCFGALAKSISLADVATSPLTLPHKQTLVARIDDYNDHHWDRIATEVREFLGRCTSSLNGWISVHLSMHISFRILGYLFHLSLPHDHLLSCYRFQHLAYLSNPYVFFVFLSLHSIGMGSFSRRIRIFLRSQFA